MLTVSLSSEPLTAGAVEEQATFGLFAVTANDRLLTAGEDTEHGELRHGPHVAGYPLAEWLVWNWWRLRWEYGRPPDGETALRWDFSHRMATIGDGYSWPNITIFSDGVQVFLASDPSRDAGTVLFRYLGASGYQTVPATELEDAIDGFVGDILARLEGRELRDTNLHHLWNDLETERQDQELARFRRLEAQLGCDPDEIDEDAIRSRLDDAAALGEEALTEVAADAALRGHAPDRMMSAAQIMETAGRNGFDADVRDAIMLSDAMAVPWRGEVGDDEPAIVGLSDATAVPWPGEVEAWRVGQRLAQTLRGQESLDGHPVSDQNLADFAGTTNDAISNDDRRSDDISFVLDRDGDRARISLRSKWQTGRRFDLARLIGDRVLGNPMGYAEERLFPATRAYSYRQKMQRAFAAEFLSPFDAVDDMLGDDYSEEKQNDVAEHFNVSPMTIRTQLVNYGRIDRRDAPDIVGRGTNS